jgi:hypothetical protein
MAGILFLLQLIPYYIGHEEILGSILYRDDLLTALTSNRGQVALAVLLEVLSAFCFVGFSVILFQVLKRSHPAIATLYLGLRFVEFGIIVFSEIKVLSLLSIARLQSLKETSTANDLEELARIGLYEWQWVTLIYMLVFCVNALFFYYLLFVSRIVPRFISIWGWIGALLAMSTPILLMYGKSTAGFIIYAPIGFNELFLAIWLILKGFDQKYGLPHKSNA